MAAESTFALCALALLFQTSSSQYLPFRECNGFGAKSTGGGFIVTSSSPIAPIGVSVVSNNLYEGTLFIEGDLPLLGSVGLEGVMGTAGAGAVSYGCGDGTTGIEGPIAGSGYLGPCYGNGVYGLFYGNGLGLNYGSGVYGLDFGIGCGFGYGNGFYGLGGYGAKCASGAYF